MKEERLLVARMGECNQVQDLWFMGSTLINNGKPLDKEKVRALAYALQDYLHSPEYHGCGCSEPMHEKDCQYLRLG